MINTKSFVLAGNATFTVTSRKTGTRFTYKVKASDDGKLHFVSVLTGPDNWTNYSYMGVIAPAQPEGNPSLGAAPVLQFRFARPEKARVSASAPSAQGFAWLWRNLDNPALTEKVEVHHEGKCCRCGRKLTVPESIESGIGPECAGKMGM